MKMILGIFVLYFVTLGNCQKNYQIIKEKVDWYTAYKSCLNKNQELATVTCGKTQAQLGEAITKGGNDIAKEKLWIAGTNQGENNKPFWMTTGKDLTFTNWAQGQPGDAKQNEKCVAVIPGPAPNETRQANPWKMEDCNEKAYYVCQKRDCMGTGDEH